MSKGLEALERIEVDMEYVTRLDFVEPIVRGEVQQDLYRIYHREEKDLDIIKKELQALEIIKKKQVQVAILLLSNSCVGYNMTRGLLGEYLEQEEYDLVRGALFNEEES